MDTQEGPVEQFSNAIHIKTILFMQKEAYLRFKTNKLSIEGLVLNVN